MDLSEIAAELYSLPLDEFIAARKRLAMQARAAGDRGLAAEVQALRKPTVAAWHVNQLVREHPDEVTVLIDLGRELRAGISGLDGAELRELTRRRHQLVTALLKQAEALAAGRGAKLAPEAAGGVRATLEATLSDPDAAEAVAAGTLAEVLQVSGFGFGGAGLMAPPPDGEPAPVADLAAHRERKSGSIERAEKDVEEAQEIVTASRRDADSAERELQKADEARAVAAVKVKRAEKKLRKVRSELDARSDDASRARDANRSSQLALRDAERKLAKAQRRLEDLAGD